MIELIGLYKSFPNVQALTDIHLFVQESEIFGIIGRSGAGKSTLLRTINLLETPDQGEVIVDNEELTRLPLARLREMRHKIGMIFQHFNLLQSKTVFENIALPMRIQGNTQEHIEQKVSELLTVVDLQAKKDAYPSALSGGQKQRVAIARALSCSPKVLLCDEATSALDPETTESILVLLKKINTLYGITIVFITHEMQVVKKICHRFAIMENGRILETMPLARVFENPYSQAFSMFYSLISPPLPSYLIPRLSYKENNRPLLRLFFQEEAATVPFISQTSRELQLDINILLANIDRFDTVTCGVLVVELQAPPTLLATFIERCKQAKLTVEIVGYVSDPVI